MREQLAQGCAGLRDQQSSNQKVIVFETGSSGRNLVL